MEYNKLLKVYFSHIMMALTSIFIIGGCSDNQPVKDFIPGPIQILRFTDNEDFTYLWPEIINVNGEEQTFTIRLQSIDILNSIEGKDEEAILAQIDTFHLTIYEWEGDKEIRKYYIDYSEDINQPDDFYHIWCESEEGKPVIKVSLKRNDTKEPRNVSFDAWPDIKYKGSPIFGYVLIKQEPAITEGCQFTAKIKYKDRYYTSGATNDEYGNIVYTEEDFLKVMNEIDATPNIKIMIMEDGVAYYYDDNDIKQNQPYKDILALQNDEHMNMQTRANDGFADYNWELGYFGIFEHKEFSGSKITKSFDNFDYAYDLPRLSTRNMNDKISSIALAYNGTDPLVCSVLTIWDDSDFNFGDDNRNKHRISIIASSKARITTVTDLKNIKKHNSSSSWNDCISSTAFHFGYIDSLLLDY